LAFAAWSVEDLMRYFQGGNTEVAEKEISVKTSVNSGITIKETEKGEMGGLLFRGAGFMTPSWCTHLGMPINLGCRMGAL